MTANGGDSGSYRLDEQIGFLLRQTNQRHIGIFSKLIPGLTPMQFAAMAKLAELGAVSQNELGRQTAMDAATIKGVVDRLGRKGLTATRPDPNDQRRLIVELSDLGRQTFADTAASALQVTADTLKPLTDAETERLLGLLRKLL